MKLVLLRHGESTWNQENRFTGWTDVDLSEKGKQEAKIAGQILKQHGFTFDIAYTSFLKRAIKTLWIALEELDLTWIDVKHAWQLNERHYGALQGLNKAEMAEKFGEEQVHIWRRSYDVKPPALSEDDPRFPGNDIKYVNLGENQLPRTESLKDTVARFLPYWHENIITDLRENKKIIIVAHGNSLRALIKHLDKISDDEITMLNIPTGIPLVYELKNDFTPIQHYYLADQKQVDTAINSVEKQGKPKG